MRLPSPRRFVVGRKIYLLVFVVKVQPARGGMVECALFASSLVFVVKSSWRGGASSREHRRKNDSLLGGSITTNIRCLAATQQSKYGWGKRGHGKREARQWYLIGGGQIIHINEIISFIYHNIIQQSNMINKWRRGW